MPAPELTFELVDAALAAEYADELLQLHAEACAGPLDGQEAALTAKRFRVQRRQPGFVLAEARSGGYLVGFASGQPLRPSTSWWRDLTTALPEEVTAERPGRTFALNEVVVRAPWRRQGIGSDLHDLVIRGRPEERHGGDCARRRPGPGRVPGLGLAPDRPPAGYSERSSRPTWRRQPCRARRARPHPPSRAVLGPPSGQAQDR